jgi:hypothetical protein
MPHSISDQTLSNTSWLRRLDAAPTSKDVMWVVRDYLATWRPEDIARLPQSCRPGLPSERDDVSYVAYQLKRNAINESPAQQKMNRFFGAATRRLGDFTSVLSVAAARSQA